MPMNEFDHGGAVVAETEIKTKLLYRASLHNDDSPRWSLLSSCNCIQSWPNSERKKLKELQVLDRTF